MIADTSFVIDLMKKLPEAEAKLVELEKRSEQVLITSISVFELAEGYSRGKPDDNSKISRFLDYESVIVFEPHGALAAGEIKSRLKKEGKSIGIGDCMIAGIAISGNDRLLTRNVKDFSRIKELQLETY